MCGGVILLTHNFLNSKMRDLEFPHLWPSLQIMYTYAKVCTRVDIRLVVKRKEVPRHRDKKRVWEEYGFCVGALKAVLLQYGSSRLWSLAAVLRIV